ncbi:MAG TPA: leucyl aminopeptidase family protein [Kiritimatiellia bacterium]|nr:leucyl aminopeptidase family protein [Kiritimatiellia bacterium]
MQIELLTDGRKSTRQPTARALLLRGDSCAAPHPPVAIPRAEWNQIRAWIARTRFRARPGDFSRLHIRSGDGMMDVFLHGLGSGDDATPRDMRQVGGVMAVQANRNGLTALDVHIASPPDSSWSPLRARALATGLREGAYEIKPTEQKSTLIRIRLDAGGPAGATDFRRAIARGLAVGDAINDVRVLANRPGNEAPPRVIAQFARRLARQHQLTCRVWGPAELKRERCDALRAVAQGSREPPCLIQLHYPGRRRDLRPLVVIGKTITFDTGGISLKPGKNMEWMKFDKSGGMTVLAFMSLVGSILKPGRPVIGLLAAAENMPGSAATRPGDVVRSRNGKTIEIVNTDAEGRLVLADALDVALEFKPAGIIDFATLTGAASVALGRPFSALLGNHPGLRESLQAAGESSGDRVWPLPLCREYRKLIQSPFADLKNIGDGSAGTIVGGMFLQEFVRPGTPWAHVDLTSAWEERATAHGPAGATIFGAALLAQWVDEGGLESLDT